VDTCGAQGSGDRKPSRGFPWFGGAASFFEAPRGRNAEWMRPALKPSSSKGHDGFASRSSLSLLIRDPAPALGSMNLVEGRVVAGVRPHASAGDAAFHFDRP